MRKYTTHVGMDVHARSIAASAIDVETGEVFNRSFAGCPAAADVAGWLEGLPQPLYCAYESGCTGFALARGLRELGYDCDVIAVSTLPKSAKDKKQKCDRLDARAIRREIANPDSGYSVVWVPDEKTEADRDLVRCYRVAVDAAKQAKQRLLMFLLRHGKITKAGDKYLRRALIEGYSGIAAWKSGKKAAPRGAEPSAACRSIASRANDRLYARYDHLARGKRKNANKAKVAVVNELVRWIWVIGLQVQDELRGEGAAA